MGIGNIGGTGRLGITPNTGVRVWYDANAVLDFDPLNSRFRFDGVSYTDETAFLAAIGGTKSGLQRTIGPYVDPASPELILNGGFATDLTNWTTVLNGTSTAAVVSAAAQFVSDGASGNGAGGAGITQGFASVLDECYRVLISNPGPGTTVARIGGTTPTGVGAIAKSLSPGAVDAMSTWSADGTTSYVYPCRTAAGTSGADAISVKKCRPFKNFAQGGFTARVRGVTPAVAAGAKMALALSQRHDTEPADRVDLRYNASGELHVLASYGGSTVADLNLGAVAPSTAFDVWLTAAPNDFAAFLNNGVPLRDATGGVPGFGALYIGKDIVNSNWDGGDLRVQIYTGGGFASMFSQVSNALHFDGDSFAGGAYGVILPNTLCTTSGRPVYNTGVGGDTMNSISARLASAPSAVRAKTTVIWDGDQNGITTVSAYCDLLATAIAALGHGRFIIIPACVNYGQADVSQEVAIRDEMLVRWPNNVLDWRGVLTLDGNGVPVSTMYAHPTPDALNDNTHLSQAAMDLMAAAIKVFIEARGW